MATVIVACIILHNMIVEDEWEDAGINDNYLRDDPNFVADEVTHDDVDEATRFREVRKQYMNEAEHFSLKQDLIQHLWDRRGEE